MLFLVVDDNGNVFLNDGLRDGEILRLTKNLDTNVLTFFRYNQPNFEYNPVIHSFSFVNSDIHHFNVGEEKFWSLTIPKSTFRENINVLNVRINVVSTSDNRNLRDSFVSSWELTNTNDLLVRMFKKNTHDVIVDVNNVSLIVQTI